MDLNSVKPQLAAPAAPAAALVQSAPVQTPAAASPRLPQRRPHRPLRRRLPLLRRVAMADVEQALTVCRPSKVKPAHVHEQYLANEGEYGRIFSQITQMGVGLVSNPNANPQQIDQALAALQSIERSMMRFHDHQAETLHVHEQYLKGQEEFARQYVSLVKQQFETSGGRSVQLAPRLAPVAVRFILRPHNPLFRNHLSQSRRLCRRWRSAR